MSARALIVAFFTAGQMCFVTAYYLVDGKSAGNWPYVSALSALLGMAVGIMSEWMRK